MMFNINEDSVFEAIDQAMKEAQAALTEDQIVKIVNAIDNSVPGLIQLLVQDTKENWKQEAIESGTGWGEIYATAIKSDVNEKEGKVYLDESMKYKKGKPVLMFVKMIEEGVKSWSIKDALLNSEKAKTGKDGIKYITVPFPVRTPAKKGQGKMMSRFGGREMTQEMYKIVKSGGKVKSGTIDVGGKEINISGLSKWTTEQRHSQYGIFRRVSERSVGWQYPTIGDTPVFPSVVDYVDKRIREILDKFCLAVIKEYS